MKIYLSLMCAYAVVLVLAPIGYFIHSDAYRWTLTTISIVFYLIILAFVISSKQ